MPLPLSVSEPLPVIVHDDAEITGPPVLKETFPSMMAATLLPDRHEPDVEIVRLRRIGVLAAERGSEKINILFVLSVPVNTG